MNVPLWLKHTLKVKIGKSRETFPLNKPSIWRFIINKHPFFTSLIVFHVEKTHKYEQKTSKDSQQQELLNDH